MPKANPNQMNFYALPVGQGDAQILQCPNGDVNIIDLGSSSGQGFWQTEHIRKFLSTHFKRIKNIVITHNDIDHYSFFSKVFPSNKNSQPLPALNKIYISCTETHMNTNLLDWINSIGADGKLQTINGGKQCGYPVSNPCENIELCEGNQGIVANVLSANAGQCKPGKSNEDSIVMNITYGEFSMQLNGDFMGVRKSNNVIKCNDYLHVTVYKLAHHGSDVGANTPKMCDAVRPKAVFASSDPGLNYHHPRCSVFDRFIKNVKSLCKPKITKKDDDFYCEDHPINNLSLQQRLQKEYQCGDSDGMYDRTGNQFAIYTTAPNRYEINLIRLVTDGTKWGFVNKITARL